MASKHTTSIVDISEIEDDEAPLAPSAFHGHHSEQQRHNPSALHAHHYAVPAHHQETRTSPAQLYLYNEDLNPRQRIPTLLSTMVNSPQGAQLQPPGQQEGSHSPSAGMLSSGAGVPSIDYPANTSVELSTFAGVRPTPSPAFADEPTNETHSRPFTPGDTVGASSSAKSANLGTLTGVYFPCVQNIFGVILFIRMVWIVGTAGVPAAFALVFICCCVTLTTSISLSAIATNGIVPAGGPYFMISRSLGPECGGAVGTMFFLGTTVAGAMYITGAVEIMLNYIAPSWGLFGDFQRDVNIMYHNIRVYGTVLLILVGLLVWIGVKFVSKLAPVALFCVLLSIFSIYAGIIINYNGRPDLMICVLGDRLVTLKNMPYEEPAFADTDNQQLYYGRNMSKLSASEQAAMLELRRTKSLCTYDKLRYIYCPDEHVSRRLQSDSQQREQAAISEYSSDPQTEPQPQQDPSQQEPSSGESKVIVDLFKRPPNMSNCDPYFRANKDRIHMEKAVPGIASGVLFENLKPRFRSKRTIVSYDDGVNTNERSDFNQVFVDITTSFTILISIYFPSCTGILAGSNRSGDLTDAQKSIPRGTLAAQLTTSFVYLSCIVLFGATFNNLFIRDKFGESMGGQLAVTQIAWPHPYVILIGGLLSTLGASLQSLVGAPRVLQGIAKDEVIPCFRPFAKLSERGEPETAILFTLCLSWLAVLIGNLDFIAPILTISLVMCYFFINLACTLHSLLGSPNWRPRFKHYHWSISTLGCLLCLFVMIVSSLVYFLIAIFIAGCLYKYIEFSGAEKEWGDGKQGLALSAARYNLLRLKTSEPHTKNWRPQLLLFCKLKPGAELEPPSAQATQTRRPHNNGNLLALTSGPDWAHAANSDYQTSSSSLRVAHPKLLTFASQLKAGKGLTLVSSIIEGDFKQLAPAASRARASLQESMNQERVKGFADVVVAPSLMDGLSYQVQTAGLGGLKHNTVIVGWPQRWRRVASTSASKAAATAVATGATTTATSANSNPSASGKEQARGSFKQQQQHQHQQQRPPSTRAHLFIELMRNVQMSQNAFLVIKGVDSWPESCDKLGGHIDIWWIVNDGGLLMLLPHLLRQHRTWKSCQLRIFTVAQANDNVVQMREDLTKFLYHLRIEAQVDIVEMNNAEVSDYAYERTLMMEQRSEIIKRLNVNRKQSLLLEQEIDGRVMRFRIRKPSTCDFEDTIPFQHQNQYQAQQQQQQQQQQQSNPSPISEHLPLTEGQTGNQGVDFATPGSQPSATNMDANLEQQVAEQQRDSGAAGGGGSRFGSNMRPDETNVRRMHTALSLNEAILKRSKSAKLVIINLPGAPKASTPEAENNYMEFIEIITDKLERVLLVQNGGREVITIHS